MRAFGFITAILTCATIASCAGEPRPQGSHEQASSTAREDTGNGRRSADATVPVCLKGDPFVEDGRIPVATTSSGSDARIDTLRWETYDGCARFVIDFTSQDGRPAAAVGGVAAQFMRDLGVVRIDLPDVSGVDPEAADAHFEGLAEAAYAVNAPGGAGFFVDLHLGAPAEAHVVVLDEPARVVIDLRPGGSALPPQPAAGRQVVVLEPRAGAQSYPLTVRGYARTFEANVVARLEKDGQEAGEKFTTATGWVDAWGHYSMTFEDGPNGSVVLLVGEYSARDGAWQGVAVDLMMR